MVYRMLRMIIFLSIMAALFGCASQLTPLTESRRLALTSDLDRVQFYISHRVDLRHSSLTEAREVTPGWGKSLKLVHSEHVERIIIKPYTRGVLQRIEGDTLFVQFEPPRGDPRRSLPFHAVQLYPEGGKEDTVFFVLDKAQVEYEGRVYDVIFSEEEQPVTSSDQSVYADKAQRSETVQYIVQQRFPFLMINPFEELHSVTEDKRKLPGLRPTAP